MSLLGGPASSPRAPLPSSKARMKKLPKKSQNEKYRLKYLRLRKAAKATVFVSLTAARRLSASTLLSLATRLRTALPGRGGGHRGVGLRTPARPARRATPDALGRFRARCLPFGVGED